MNTKNGTVGGGEVLKYWNQNDGGPGYLDTQLIRQFLMLPFVRVLIIVLLMVAAVLLLINIFKVRNPLKGKALTHELEHLDAVKKRDESIVAANRTIQIFTKVVEKTPFAMNKMNIDYWTYNLTRANIRIPGGARIIRPDEFNAIVSAIEFGVMVIAVLIMVLFNLPLGVVLFISSIVVANTMPMIVIRQAVKDKDMEIVENFADFYLMIHYVLLASAGTPISGIMKSYDKTTDSEEMHRFIDVCIHNIDTYGEYEATRHIARQYREINEVGKLMRLIRQANEGGDVRAELMGFRSELLAAKKYAISKRMDKMVMKAKLSFNILTPILIQAIISAMAIYLPDIGVAGSLFG